MNILKTYQPNPNGRDFVIGDLHGSFPVLVKLLEHIAFDPEKDRMFSVGDLVDRGPDSLNCLRLIRESWFHPVLSNHEQMMIQAFKGGYMGNFWVQNGGQWGVDAWNKHDQLMLAKCNDTTPPVLSDEERDIIALVEEATELPYLITVNVTPEKKFHVIHAELPPGALNVTDEVLSSPNKVYELATSRSNDGESFLWARHLFASVSRRDLNDLDKVKRTVAYSFSKSFGPFNDELSHIISGHSIVQKPVTIIGQTNIDTCAFGSCFNDGPKWAGLTCVNLKDWTFTKTTLESHEEVQPIEINKDYLLSVRHK